MKAKEVPVQFTRRYTLEEHTCPECGKTFEAPRLRRYCSDTCKNRAAWERNGGKVIEARKQERLRKQQS
jgi:rRNA maturation protein Nop10